MTGAARKECGKANRVDESVFAALEQSDLYFALEVEDARAFQPDAVST